MKLTDERLDEILESLVEAKTADGLLSHAELASMANELNQLRLRTSSRSRTSAAGRANLG